MLERVVEPLGSQASDISGHGFYGVEDVSIYFHI